MTRDYHAYLASREWALLKNQVRERSGGLCERCGAPQQATHHLTYERVGSERLEDLLAVCNPCHEYLSAKRDDDPAAQEVAPKGAYIRIPRDADLSAFTRTLDAVVAVLAKAADPDGWPVYLVLPTMHDGERLEGHMYVRVVHPQVYMSREFCDELASLVGEDNVSILLKDGKRPRPTWYTVPA